MIQIQHIFRLLTARIAAWLKPGRKLSQPTGNERAQDPWGDRQEIESWLTAIANANARLTEQWHSRPQPERVQPAPSPTPSVSESPTRAALFQSVGLIALEHQADTPKEPEVEEAPDSPSRWVRAAPLGDAPRFTLTCRVTQTVIRIVVNLRGQIEGETRWDCTIDLSQFTRSIQLIDINTLMPSAQGWFHILVFDDGLESLALQYITEWAEEVLDGTKGPESFDYRTLRGDPTSYSTASE